MDTTQISYLDAFYGNRVFFGVIAMILGMLIGSFLNVVIWRLPRGESLSYPPSHCPKCGHRIPWYENIPLFSWLCLRGHCSSCHLPISWRYPAGETSVGVLFLLIYLHIASAGLTAGFCLNCLWLAPILLAGALIDIDHRIIPDKLNFFALAVAVIIAAAWPSARLALVFPENPQSGAMIFGWLAGLLPELPAVWSPLGRLLAVGDVILGALLGFLLLGAVAMVGKLLGGKKGLEVMGGGDVKFLAVIGAFLGADATVYILFTAAVIGCLAGFIKWMAAQAQKQTAKNKNNDEQKIKQISLPFGPFLAAAGLLWCLFGNFFYNLFHLFANFSQ